MIIKFKTLQLHNFMSYTDTIVHLDSDGYTLISGVNNNSIDNADSNGSGKSAIWEALSWCLTGETIRGCKSVANEFTDDGCFVKIEFIMDNNIYEIIRSKDSKEYKTNLLLFVNGQNKSGKGIRDTSKILSEYIPDLTSSLIGSVIILGQGLPLRFTGNTPSGRKEVLEKLIKSDFMIADLKNRITSRKSVLDKQLRTSQDNLLVKSTQLNTLQEQKDNYESQLASLSQIDVDRELLDMTLLLINKKENEYAVEAGLLHDVEKESEEASTQYNQLSDEYNHALATLKDKYNSRLRDYEVTRASIKNKIDMFQKEVIRLQSIKDICPTCGQKIPGVVKPNTIEQEQQINDLNTELTLINNNISDLNSSTNTDVDNLNNTYVSKLNVLYETMKSCSEKCKCIESELKQLDNDIHQHKEEANNYRAKIDSYTNHKQEIESQLRNTVARVNKIQDEILYINDEISNINQHIQVISRFNSIVTRDFRGILLQNVITCIDAHVKEYSKYLFNDSLIEFTLDGNNISITLNGKEYESLSGGERQKVDIIIQFSIRDMLCEYMNFSSNILVLDEITDNLDKLGCQNVLQLINNELKDVESIYIISHRKDLDIPFDRKLIVEKNDKGFSVIH
jgi:DNA repair exonuclease SbcCD ATPase subunit